MVPESEDQQKLDALKRFFVLDHAPEESDLDRLVRFAAQLFGVTYAALSIRNDEGLDKIVAGYGFDISVLEEDAVLIEKPAGPSIPVTVEDASEDQRFLRNPLVNGGLGDQIGRMYAGVPLKSAQGFTLGTLAIMDPHAQEITSEGVAMLSEVGALVEPVLELARSKQEHQSTSDTLSRVVSITRTHLEANYTSLATDADLLSALASLCVVSQSDHAALFAFVKTDPGQRLAACVRSYSAGDSATLVEIGTQLDFVEQNLSDWQNAFASNTPATKTPDSSFFSGLGCRHLAAFPIHANNGQPGFVLFERGTNWMNEELSAMQGAILPLRDAFPSPDNDPSASTLVRTPNEDHSHGCLVVTGREGTILSATERAHQLLYTTAERLEGHNLLEFVGTNQLERALNFLAQAPLGSDLTPSIDLYLGESTGHDVYLRLTASPCEHEGQEAAQICLHDVSDLHHQIRDLATSWKDVQALAESKADFLAQMSHEIRTALTSIIGNTEFLADDLQENSESRSLVNAILSSSEKLLSTLNSVMDLSRLESVNGRPELQSVSIGPVLKSIHSTHLPEAAAKDLTFIVGGTDKQVYVQADSVALSRALNNLVSNAIKFTDKGGVRVRVVPSRDSGEINIEVQDTGVGIDEAFLPQLFTAFEQEQSELERTKNGSGLGLSLSKRLVELMGGEISVRSRKGQGSVFKVTLRASTHNEDLQHAESHVESETAPSL